MLIATGNESSGSKTSGSLTVFFACNVRADSSDQQESIIVGTLNEVFNYWCWWV